MYKIEKYIVNSKVELRFIQIICAVEDAVKHTTQII